MYKVVMVDHTRLIERLRTMVGVVLGSYLTLEAKLPESIFMPSTRSHISMSALAPAPKASICGASPIKKT